MSKRTKKFIVFIILNALFIILYPSITRAETTVGFTVSSATARINDIVNITVCVNDAVNVVSGKLTLTYNPTELELVIPENGLEDIVDSIFFKGGQVSAKTPEIGKINIAFAKENPITNTGTILNLQFKVLKEEGSFPVTLEVAEYFDVSNTQFTTTVTNGTINSTKLIKGDINNDGKIRLYDALQILKQAILGGNLTEDELYIMDYNDDGQVTLYDSLKFLQQAILG